VSLLERALLGRGADPLERLAGFERRRYPRPRDGRESGIDEHARVEHAARIDLALRAA